MKRGIFCFLVYAGVFYSCSDHKDIYNPNSSRVQYEESWKKKFGDIDPNQTWNVATLVDLRIDLDENASVDFFYIDEGKSYNLAHYELKAGASSFSIDVPKEIKTLYAVKSGGANYQELAIPVGNGGGIDVIFRTPVNPRKVVTDLTPQSRKKVTLLAAEDYIQSGFADEYYAANQWGILGGIGSAHVDYLQTGLTAYPYTLAIIEELKKAENKESVLSKYADDFSAKTTNSGEISLITLPNETSANPAVGYFYTSENTEAAMKTAPKYILLPGIKQCNAGAKLKLTYYGPDGKGTPTFTFPKDVYIHFFLLRGAGNNDLKIPAGKDGLPERYEINGLYQFYSSSQLNAVVSRKGGFRQVPVMANFSTGGNNGIADGVNVLSFEDWPKNKMVDWNDFAFILDGPFKSFKRFQEEFDWTVVFEDLGDTDDFDFNDVVLGVKHLKKGQIFSDGTQVITSSALEVYLCAAGGTLPATVYYNNEQIGKEVHEAFGVSAQTMVNTTSLTKDYVSLGHFDVAPDFSLTNDANKFSIIVDEETSVSFPRAGQVPQAICVAGNWAWPTERTSIADAYSAFTNWATNQSNNSDWYKTPNSGKVVTE